MIRTLILAILVSFISVTALAEHENTQPTQPEAPQVSPFNKLPIMVDCGSQAAVFDVLRKYGEQPVLSLEVLIMTPGGQVLKHPRMLFMNPDKSTWSLIADFPETGGACIVQNGVNIEAVGDPNNKS